MNVDKPGSHQPHLPGHHGHRQDKRKPPPLLPISQCPLTPYPGSAVEPAAAQQPRARRSSRRSSRPTTGSASMMKLRIPIVGYLPLHAKNHMVAMLSEFVGTFLFLLFALGGTNVVNAPAATPNGATTGEQDLAANPAKLLYIALCFGMSLAVNAWVFFRISGGLFNPAVTLGMMVVGAVGLVRGVLVMIAQVAGGIAASGVISAMCPGPLNVRTSLGGGTSVVQGLFIEMFLTAQLVFTIFMLAAEKHRATFIAPVGIGLSLFIAELMGVYYTGGSLNPARSFGPSVVLGTFFDYHWIYWVGPILGSLLASGFYLLVKALEYETVNPDVDEPGDRGEAFDPDTGEEKEVKADTPNLQLGTIMPNRHAPSPPTLNHRRSDETGETHVGSQVV